MAKRPIPRGYYAMTVEDLRSFLDDGLWETGGRIQLKVEIDGERFPVIKIVREGANGAIVLRVPPNGDTT